MKVIAILVLILGFLFVLSVTPTRAPDAPLISKVTPAPTQTPLPKYITLFLTGDVMLGRSVMKTYIENGDYLFPFRLVGEKMRNADLTFINLENPIIKDCKIHIGGFTFCAPPESVQGLIYAGVDVVSLANNHSANYGQDGISQTGVYLNEPGIEATGLGNLVVKEAENTKFGFLAFDKSQQSNPKLTDGEVDLIKQSDQSVDVLVVGVHWGVEYQDKALPGVRTLAKQIVEMGADVVVGHHPHWVQEWEMIEDAPVYYSLGNFVFDQMWSEETRQGMAVKLYFEGNKFVRDEKFKTYTKNLGQPEWVN